MNIHDLFYLLLIMLGAYLMPAISRKLMLPSPVGEMLFGVGISFFWQMRGPNPGGIVHFLADLGFVMLMYLAGMEIELALLKKRPLRDLLAMAFYFVMMLLLSIWLVMFWGGPPILALMMTMVAIGLLFPVLKELKLLDTPVGRNLLLLGTVGEVVSLLSLTFFSLWVQTGFSTKSLLHLLQLAGFALGTWLLLRFYRWLVWWYPHLLSPFYHIGDDAQEGGVRASLLNVFLFVTLALWLNLEIIVGAFLGGVLFGDLLHQKEQIKQRLGTLAYGFLVPLFFIHVGMNLPLNLLDDWNIWFNAFLMSAVLLGIRLVCAPVLRLAGFRRKDYPLFALGLSFPLTLLVAVSTFGYKSGLLTAGEFATGLLVSMITSLIYPLIFKHWLIHHHKVSSARPRDRRLPQG
jgi:Kef-type K+ transport system membrane component KefB